MNSVTIVRKFKTKRSPTENHAPEPPEALVDQPGVTDPGDRAQPDHHLLVDDQDGDQQQQHPQQAGPVVLTRLRVGRDAPGVVVADHHDQPGPDDRQQRQQRGSACRGVPSSCWPIVPKAPRMSPTCAESSTKRSRVGARVAHGLAAGAGAGAAHAAPAGRRARPLGCSPSLDLP